jgi:hypothetical protein
MKNILQKLLLILSVFLAVDLTAGPIEEKTPKNLVSFVAKMVRSENGTGVFATLVRKLLPIFLRYAGSKMASKMYTIPLRQKLTSR